MGVSPVPSIKKKCLGLIPGFSKKQTIPFTKFYWDSSGKWQTSPWFQRSDSSLVPVAAVSHGWPGNGWGAAHVLCLTVFLGEKMIETCLFGWILSSWLEKIMQPLGAGNMWKRPEFIAKFTIYSMVVLAFYLFVHSFESKLKVPSSKSTTLESLMLRLWSKWQWI